MPEDVADETRWVLRKVAAVLEAAGLSDADVVKTTIHMTILDNYAVMNEAYGEFLSDTRSRQGP